MRLPLFVYGTLCSDGDQGALLAHLSRVAATARGTLWDLPQGYPALGPGERVVHGELVEPPDPRLLALLDAYEGVDEGLYRRVHVDVTVGLRTVRAWAYTMDDPRLQGGRLVADGRWKRARRR